MKFHIVRDGETIREIMFLYSITEDELKEENRHIRSWDRLIPGTKLKVPALCEADDNDILQMEPFIEDYYPKDINLDTEEKKEEVVEEETKEKILDSVGNEIIKIDEIEEVKTDEPVKEIYVNKPRIRNNQKRNVIYYPYYVYYPIYSPYYFNYKKGK